jgi:hypothetical protein
MPAYATYRRCPSCHAVSQAALFRRAGGPTFAASAAQRRSCPACGHVGPLASFPIIERPKPDQAEELMPSRPRRLRYRRCPACQVVRPASAFRRAGGSTVGGTFAASAALRRRCPACGHSGPLRDFSIVERPEGT